MQHGNLDQYKDHPLSDNTVDIAPYRTILGCFRPVTTRNKSLMVDFNRRCPLLSGISLAAVRKEAAREKEEERERGRIRGRTSTRPDSASPSLDDPDLVDNGEVAVQLRLRRVLCRMPEMFAAVDVFNTADEEKPQQHRLLFSSSP
ncbi:hypothetical protein BHE74_00017447 [Ensete ventricosum]|nr:hypothetical protein GW17_00025046 [Ensete ventricosum]RWW74609.1 hypothetical protein BHE74_00017447 [Ensete ventricosum]RZR96653.1 hypothetical protein BHM03_00025703 [Ensete ventricosum]